VLFLAPGGKTAYCGPPRDIGAVLGSTDWADLFTQVGADPEAAHRDFLSRCRAHLATATSSGRRRGSPAAPARCRLVRQVSTLARRQIRLILADRGYLLFLAVLPFILGVLALLVPGETGLGTANPRGPDANEAAQIVMLLNISAVFMGTALTIRDLVGERAIFRREQAAGLSASAYLCAKIAVYCVTAAAQTAVLTAIVVAGKGAPTRGAVAVGDPILELYLTLAATAAVGAATGLAMSAVARSQDQILPMLVIAVMLSMVFCGGLIPVSGRPILDQLSWAIPARWGFAATASTTDLRAIAPMTSQHETLWSHDLGWWLLNMTGLIALGAVLVGFVRWRIRLGALCPISRRTARLRWRMPLRLGVTWFVGYRVMKPATAHRGRPVVTPSVTSAALVVLSRSAITPWTLALPSGEHLTATMARGRAMSVVEPAGVSVVQTEGGHAGIWHCLPSNDAMVASPRRMLPSADGDETGGRPPVDVIADQHPALHLCWPRAFRTNSAACHRSPGGIGVYPQPDGVCMSRRVVQTGADPSSRGDSGTPRPGHQPDNHRPGAVIRSSASIFKDRILR
jgi:hypothetical protein